MVNFLVTLLCVSAFAAESAPATNLVRQAGPGLYEIGKVHLDAHARRIVFPAQVNMLDGPVEYLVVSARGKLHESIFKTEAEPLHIHTAALLLLKEPISSNAWPRVRVAIELPDAPLVSAESFILDSKENKPLRTADWNYRGSRLVEGEFVAQRDGSILAIITDPDALIETGRIASEDDDRWRPAKGKLPPVGAPVKVILQFTGPEKKGTDP